MLKNRNNAKFFENSQKLTAFTYLILICLKKNSKILKVWIGTRDYKILFKMCR